MSAQRFLDLLEDRGMLEGSIVEELRRLTIEKKATAEVIAKVLVDRGHLTRFQATKLVGEATALAEERREAKAVQKEQDEDFIGLAPDDDLPHQGLPPAEVLNEEVVLLEPAEPNLELEGVAGLTPVEDAGAGLTPVSPAAAPAAQAGSPLEPLDLGSFDPLATPSVPARLPTWAAPRRNVWDTKLMVGGGLALLLLLLGGVVLVINLTAVPPEVHWEKAMEAYRGGSYSQAAAKFETFLSKFSNDERASEARVRLALCRIRVVLSNPARGLEQANKWLPTIESEDAMKVAREELATMLVQIPEGFLERAKQSELTAEKQQLLEQTEQGVKLIENPSWVPSSQRRAIQHRIHELNEGLTLVRRDLNQDRDLAQAIDEIDAATRERQTARAYQIYKQLVTRYPGLTRHPDLVDALKAATEGERTLVNVTEEVIEPITSPGPDARQRVVLANRQGTGRQQLNGQTIAVLADGSVYGLDAGTGSVLWGRFVGHGTLAQPVRMSSADNSGVLMVDGARQELVCLASRTGTLNWRLPMGEPMSAPVVAGQTVFLTLESGKLIEVDPATGASRRRAVTPLPLSVSTAVASDRPRAFQLAQHSNLYVISTETLQCVGIHYLGHKAGTVTVPPLVQMSHVFVAENYAADLSRLHVLRFDGDTDQLSPAQAPVELKGNVVVPMQAYGRRVLATTDLGEVRVMDVDINQDPPCRQAAALAATRKQSVAAYPLTDASTLWLADTRLAKYRIQITTGKITRQAVVHGGDVFAAPLQLFGNLLIHARREGSSAGITVTATDIDAPRKAVWQTQLGVPAGRVTVDQRSQRIHVISAAATLFEISDQVLDNGHLDQPSVSAASGSTSFTEPIELSGERVALFNPQDATQLLIYDPSQTARRLQVVSLDLPAGDVTCVPVALQDALLVPVDTGEVLWVSLNPDGREVLPFQPKLVPGQVVRWSRPAVLGQQFVIADDQRNIYRVGIKEQPRPFLSAVARARLDFSIDSALAAAGQTVYGVVRAASSDVAVAIDAAKLKVGQEWDLEGRVTWGPETIGENVLLVTDDRRLHCFEPGQKRRWSDPRPLRGRPAGPPLELDNSYIFAMRSGTVWRIAADTGQELTKVEVGEPLDLGPIAFGEQLLLSAKTGALRVIALPAGS